MILSIINIVIPYLIKSSSLISEINYIFYINIKIKIISYLKLHSLAQ